MDEGKTAEQRRSRTFSLVHLGSISGPQFVVFHKRESRERAEEHRAFERAPSKTSPSEVYSERESGVFRHCNPCASIDQSKVGPTYLQFSAHLQAPFPSLTRRLTSMWSYVRLSPRKLQHPVRRSS